MNSPLSFILRVIEKQNDGTFLAQILFQEKKSGKRFIETLGPFHSPAAASAAVVLRVLQS